MSYQALYRKYRPDSFSAVRGQDAIITTLKNQILQKRMGHAYLFCGTRGTGKTTVAKIFAKAVNCESLSSDGNPCGVCSMCREIAEGSSLNVMEIDAASNNGVDNVRTIIDELEYPPQTGYYKVYIIDEAHMLSGSAFNALLKTLEEPPSYAIFILATTEVNKLPITIRSRCQRYDFKRMRVSTIVERMRELADEEKIEAEPQALSFIARCADGSMRDALSLLDQCLAFNFGEALTLDKALEALGQVDTGVFGDFLRKIQEKDVAGSLSVIDAVLMQGRDIQTFVSDFIWYLRNLLLIKSNSENIKGSDGDQNIEDALGLSADNIDRLREESALIDTETLVRYIHVLSSLSSNLRNAGEKRVLFEIAAIKLIKPEMENDTLSLKQRISDLEKEMLEMRQTLQGARPLIVNKDSSDMGPKKAEVKKTEILPDALPEDIRAISGKWNEIRKLLRNQGERITANALEDAYPSFEGDRLVIVFKGEEAKLHYEMLQESGASGRRIDKIQEAIGKIIHKKVDFSLKLAGNHSEDAPVDVRELIENEMDIEGVEFVQD